MQPIIGNYLELVTYLSIVLFSIVEVIINITLCHSANSTITKAFYIWATFRIG